MQNKAGFKNIFAQQRRSEGGDRHIDEDLVRMIREAGREMDFLRKNYEMADDNTLIDMYIYSMKAQEMKYKHLMQIAKRAL